MGTDIQSLKKKKPKLLSEVTERNCDNPSLALGKDPLDGSHGWSSTN